jgi:hypothetical protein
VVIDDLDVLGALGGGGPFETDPSLIVDADAVLAPTVSLQRLEPVAGQRGQVVQRRGRFETVKRKLRDAERRSHT